MQASRRNGVCRRASLPFPFTAPLAQRPCNTATANAPLWVLLLSVSRVPPEPKVPAAAAEVPDEEEKEEGAGKVAGCAKVRPSSWARSNCRTRRLLASISSRSCTYVAHITTQNEGKALPEVHIWEETQQRGRGEEEEMVWCGEVSWLLVAVVRCATSSFPFPPLFAFSPAATSAPEGCKERKTQREQRPLGKPSEQESARDCRELSVTR